MKSNSFKEYIQPTVVLVAICLVITFALAYVNSIAAPIIADNTAKAADAARAELLPAATSFTKYEGDLVVAVPDKVFVEDCYVAEALRLLHMLILRVLAPRRMTPVIWSSTRV